MNTGRYVYVSDYYHTVFDQPATQLRGKTPFECFTPEMAKMITVTDIQVYETQQADVWERHISPFGADHSPDFIKVKKFPIPLNGKPWAVGGFAFPVVEIK